jgi:hypothetical protein
MAMLDEAMGILMKKSNAQQQAEIPSHLLGGKLHFVNPVHPSVKKNDTLLYIQATILLPVEML